MDPVRSDQSAVFAIFSHHVVLFPLQAGLVLRGCLLTELQRDWSLRLRGALPREPLSPVLWESGPLRRGRPSRCSFLVFSRICARLLTCGEKLTYLKTTKSKELF